MSINAIEVLEARIAKRESENRRIMAIETSILAEAANAVLGPRQAAYGHPLDNHACTATMWTAYLSRKYGACFALTPEDVCWFNVLQKVSREANSAKRDNAVDICGYAANVEMIQDERVRRKKTLGL